ncbi:MAG: hemerythrin domain-containing protein [Deltaproteobacteria bacterium]|nr:hemerythrin domain-containing protein [Deltaproteobacteria bacterium]
MTVEDALEELSHDHEDLNRQVLDIGARLVSDEPAASNARLVELREQLFLHFAREEEGLFPFVVDHFPDLVDRVRQMETAHDAICGAVARMCHMLAAGTNPLALTPVFERFELAYAGHAKVEAELLFSLRKRVDADQRLALAELVRDL